MGDAVYSSIYTTVAIAMVALIFARGWTDRKLFKNLERKHLPMPPHSYLMGHLLVIKNILSSIPKDCNPFLVFGQISKLFPHGVFYLDTWPFGSPFLIVTSLTAATQATQQTEIAYRRPAALLKYFKPITGGPNLFSMADKDWKPLRALFNPGFSNKSLLGHVEHIIEETLVYRKILETHGKNNDLIYLDDTTLRFTLDLIGRTVLNARLHAQTTHNQLASALLRQIQWQGSEEELNPFKRWNPIRPFVQWYNSYQMDCCIGKELDARLKSWSSDEFTTKDLQNDLSVIDLVLQSYIAEHHGKSDSAPLREFRRHAISQIRLFLFVGHDTTSSTLCHIYYLLSAHPGAAGRIRTEHDLVLGRHRDKLPVSLAEQPSLLSELPFTVAVIKESMRLFPAASSIRQGVNGIDISDDQGNKYPTGDCMIWILHQSLHRNPAYWKRPDEFIPDRWLVPPSDPLYPVKGAWRPFEFGPRNCIGQGLVMLELKIVLALTIRHLDIRPAYDEWDRMHPTKAIKRFNGERAYQIEKGGAHPADGFPCRIALRK